MSEVYVIWPSSGAAERRGVETLRAAIRAGRIEGYRGSPSHVANCDYIVLTSGNDEDLNGCREHYAAKIEHRSIERNGRLDSARRRSACVNLSFSDPVRISSPILDSLRWRQCNVRYLVSGDLRKVIKKAMEARK